MRRLQARIVKATQEGRWNKVQALVYLLTHSFAGRAVAIRRVIDNRGACTPGVDGDVWDTPEAKTAALHAVTAARLSTAAVATRVHSKKQRQTTTPRDSHLDRPGHASSVLAGSGSDRWRPRPIGIPTAFAGSGAVRMLWNNVIMFWATARSARWVLEGDISSCFDRISHHWLEAHIPMDKAILQRWLKAGYLEKGVFVRHHGRDTSRRDYLSRLANATLDGLESSAARTLRRRTAASRNARSIWCAMRMTSSSPAHRQNYCVRKYNLSWHTS